MSNLTKDEKNKTDVELFLKANVNMLHVFLSRIVTLLNILITIELFYSLSSLFIYIYIHALKFES